MYTAAIRSTEKFIKFTVLILIMGITACKKDKNNPAIEDPEPIARLREINNGDDFIRFTYYPDGRAKTVTTTLMADPGASVQYNITYKEDKKIEELQGSDGMRIVPVYDEELLVRAHFYAGAERVGYTNYSVLDNTTKDITYYSKSNDDFIPLVSIRYKCDAAGNPVENIMMGATEIPNHMERQGHITYQYDNKPNPLYPHRDLLALFFQPVSKNNTVRENHFDKNTIPENLYKYTYTYKLNNQPQKAIVKIGLDGMPVENKEVLYTYE